MGYNKLYEIETPAGLEAKLSDLIDRLAEKEKRAKRNTLVFRIGGIAASVVILLSIGLFYNSKGTSDTLDTPVAARRIVIEDPEIAIREAEKALLQISVNFNKGIEQLNKITKL